MTTQPLTGEQQAAIRARHRAATAGTWYLQPDHGPHFVATAPDGYEHGIGDLDFGAGDQADADREFVLNAHADMAQLLAEVGRLRAELAGARSTIDHMSQAMSWISGHDRQGLDHLDEAQSEARAREATVRQAQRWATRAKGAEVERDRLRVALTEALRVLDDGPLWVNGQVQEHWSAPAARAAGILRSTLEPASK